MVGPVGERFDAPPPCDLEVVPTAQQIAFFDEHGYLVVERITSDDEVAWLRALMEHVFSEAEAGQFTAPVDRDVRTSADRQVLRQSFVPEARYPAILQTAYHRNAKRFAAALLGRPESALSAWGHMLHKPAGGGRAAPWHQDEAYWEPELDYLALGCWLPLSDVTVDMGAMQFVPGSHRRGMHAHVHADDNPALNLLVATDVDASTAVACPLPLGGATFHHHRTLHHTATNTTDRDRLAFPMEFQIAPTRRPEPADRPWVWAFREATGSAGHLGYFADGRYVSV